MDVRWGEPWFAPWRVPGESVAQSVAAGRPPHEALDAAGPAPVRFVPQEAVPAGMAYEQFIFATRQCPVRPGPHDFFNGLAWLRFPRAKSKLNALQAQAIARDGVGARRGPVRDAITVFDENGALLAAPPLLCALLAVLALAAGLMAWLPPQTARAPLAGLLVLALPLLSSLQYYGGYPLRVLTAQASTWLLQLAGIAAERAGSSMLVRGQLVIVDAPCSGVQMVWMAYFCACAFAALAALRDAAFLKRLPFVGALVLLGNVLRNTVLVALESRPHGLDARLHEGFGLAVLAVVCAAVIVWMNGGRRDTLV